MAQLDLTLKVLVEQVRPLAVERYTTPSQDP